ncbi:hypothetical protein FKM82_001576 [Ascaphus truei]
MSPKCVQGQEMAARRRHAAAPARAYSPPASPTPNTPPQPSCCAGGYTARGTCAHGPRLRPEPPPQPAANSSRTTGGEGSTAARETGGRHALPAEHTDHLL